MAKRAAREALLHRVLYYTVLVTVSRCQASPATCTSVRTAFSANYTYGSCPSDGCSLNATGVASGEYVKVTVTPFNVAGAGPSATEVLRFIVLPSPDVQVVYSENFTDPLRPVAELSWGPPSESGFGDGTAAPILGYRVEVMGGILCNGGFSNLSSACALYDAELLHDAHPFAYPLTWPVPLPLLQGYPYWYRVTSRNFLGSSPVSAALQLQADFVKIGSDKAYVDLPEQPIIRAAIISPGDKLQVQDQSSRTAPTTARPEPSSTMHQTRARHSGD